MSGNFRALYALPFNHFPTFVIRADESLNSRLIISIRLSCMVARFLFQITIMAIFLIVNNINSMCIITGAASTRLRPDLLFSAVKVIAKILWQQILVQRGWIVTCHELWISYISVRVYIQDDLSVRVVLIFDYWFG